MFHSPLYADLGHPPGRYINMIRGYLLNVPQGLNPAKNCAKENKLKGI